MTQSTQKPEFRNIIGTGFGFINRLRLVETEDGDYVSMVFNAQYGKKDKAGKFKTSRFALNVKQSQAEEILRDVLQQGYSDEDKLCASVIMGDLRPHLVTNKDGSPYMVDVYVKGKKTDKKEPLVEIRGSLIGLNYLSKNSEVLINEKSDHAESEESESDEAPA